MDNVEVKKSTPMLSFAQLLIPLLIIIIAIFISSSLLGERQGSQETIIFTAQIFGRAYSIHSPIIYRHIGPALKNGGNEEYLDLVINTMYPTVIGVIVAILIQYFLAVLRGKKYYRWYSWRC